MASDSSGNSFRSILRNTSVLGGTQVFLALINVIRGKFVAMILGPEGMGLSSLFTSAYNTITQGASLGLNLVMVKELAQVRDDETRRGEVLGLILRVTRATALLGALFTVLFSGWLSRVTFGSGDYAWQFALMGVGVFFLVTANAKAAVLQGMHEIKRLANASIVGALTGLLCGVPLYWWLGYKGIVPAIVLLAIAMNLFYSWNIRHLRPAKQAFSRRQNVPAIRKMLSLGLILIASDLIGRFGTYCLNLVIRTVGDIDQVGLYQAANSITAQYVGTIVASLSMDFFPRLSAAASDNRLMTRIVNRQTVVVALCMGPLAGIIITTAPLLIRLLLTESFMGVVDLVKLLGVGIYFKIMQFPMGYIAFSKGNKKVFFWLEGIYGNLTLVAFAMCGYLLFGLEGIGYGMIVENMIAFLVIWLVNRYLYGYNPDGTVIREYFIGAAVCMGCLGASCVASTSVSITAMAMIMTTSCAYSLRRLRGLLKSEKNGGEC